MNQDLDVARSRLTTPRAAAVAGILFSLLLITTLSLRTGIIPRWMAHLGLVLAVFLLLNLGNFSWTPLVFPLWVLLISVHILFANLRHPRRHAATSASGE